MSTIQVVVIGALAITIASLVIAPFYLVVKFVQHVALKTARTFTEGGN